MAESGGPAPKLSLDILQVFSFDVFGSTSTTVYNTSYYTLQKSKDSGAPRIGFLYLTTSVHVRTYML